MQRSALFCTCLAGLVAAASFTCPVGALAATTVIGTVKDATGTVLATGEIWFQLSQEGIVTDPAILITPPVKCDITAGVITACSLRGNDEISPTGTVYRVRILSATGRTFMPERTYSITSPTWDIGQQTPNPSSVQTGIHGASLHSGDVIPPANQEFGAFYSDFSEIPAPPNPASGTRRFFVDSATDELSVRTSAGTIVSLEAAGGGGSGDITSVGDCATGACFQSVPANQVFAAPDGSAGQAAFRALVDADFPSSNALDSELHAQSHVLDGADHTVSGLTIGNYVRALTASTFGFAAILDGDLPATIARDSELHAQVHALVGADHTASGLTVGQVPRATGAAAFAWQQLGFSDLGGTASDAQVDGSLEADELVLAGDVDGPANANDLDELAVEAELEAVLDLPDLQGILDVPSGGTGAAPGADDQVLVSDSTSAATWRAVPTCNTVTEKTFYNTATNTWTCEADAGAGGGAPVGVQYVVGAADATLTAEKILTDGTGIDTVLAGGDGGTATINLNYADTLEGNPSFAAKECVFTIQGASGGGFLCEGSVGGNTNEQLYLFPALDGVDTTTFIALGASDGDALAGDTATGFFDAGLLETVRGGTNIDSSGSTGFARVAAGTWSFVAASGVGACGANLFETGDNDNAAPTCAQPAFTNLSGSATDGQVPDNITIATQDNNFSLLDDIDNTKVLAFQLSSITAGTTRTVTVPDANGEMSLLGQTIATAELENNAVDDAKLRDSAATSVIGRSAGTTGDPADVAATADGQVLRRAAGALGFGAVDLADTDAVTGLLPDANIAASISRDSESVAAGDISGSLSGGYTVNAGAIASPELATANKTFKCNFTLFADTGLKDTDDVNSVSECSRPGRAITITEVIAETDAGSPIINLQRDDGTPANLLSSNCTATTGGATCTIAAAEDNFASTDKMDFVAVSGMSGANRISLMIEYIVD